MDAFYEHAETHHGVVSRAEAQALGLTTNQIDYLVRVGRLRRIAPRVYVLAGVPDTWHRNARVAALSVDGLVSHKAAARLHGIDGFNNAGLELTVSKDRRPKSSPEQLHRSSQYRFADPTVIDGLPTTGITRTVLDLAAVLPYSRFERAIDAVLRQEKCEWPELYEVLALHSIQGRNGCGPLRALLDARYGDESIPDSAWNRMVAELIIRSGVGIPNYEYTVRDSQGRFVARVDLAFPQQRVAIELDSVRWHLNRESFEKDPRRKNKLVLLGWTVLTFTWSDYIDRPASLVQAVADALHQTAA